MNHPTTKKSTRTADATVAAARHKEWLNLQSAIKDWAVNLLSKDFEAAAWRLAGKRNVRTGQSACRGP